MNRSSAHPIHTFERIMRAGRERSLWPLSTLSAQLECPDRTGMFTTPLKLFASNSLCLLSNSICPDRTPVWNLHSSSTVIYLFVSNAQSSCCLNTSLTWKAVIDSCSSNTWEIICLFGLPCGIKYEPYSEWLPLSFNAPPVVRCTDLTDHNHFVQNAREREPLRGWWEKHSLSACCALRWEGKYFGR